MVQPLEEQDLEWIPARHDRGGSAGGTLAEVVGGGLAKLGIPICVARLPSDLDGSTGKKSRVGTVPHRTSD